jgi:very-short-patch-repair endonuclease
MGWLRLSIPEYKTEGLKFTSKIEFMTKSPRIYHAAYKRGLLPLICAHMSDSNIIWDLESCIKEAKKYKTRRAFCLRNAAAYSYAVRNKLLSIVCAHMPEIQYSSGKDHYNFKWTFDKLQEEALKYTKKSLFAKHSPAAYLATGRAKILNIICSHMEKDRSSSLMEWELFDAIKPLFSSIKKLRDRKVKIKNKPFIYGFDVDIFIPELKLGIEFDGTYTHSFKKMRKDKRKAKWSDEDIRNYHEIKDAWFATKGITILHIKEEDWLKDKQACIDKCLEFLGVEQKKVA